MGWGFVLLAFPFGESQGRLNYISNGKREDVHRILREWMDKGGVNPGHH